MFTDPIADMFTRIRNAIQRRHEDVVVPFSKTKLAIVKILKEEGFIKKFDVLNLENNKKSLKIVLKYSLDGTCVIRELRRISKSGKRLYVKKSDIPKVLNGFGVNFVSTSQGILSGRSARLANVGGELIGEVF